MKNIIFTLMISALLLTFSANAQKVVTSIEKAPFTSSSALKSTATTKAQWDVLFTFETVIPGAAGIETDGNSFYTTLWNGDEFHRYTMDGTHLATFTITGISAIRDMAYDGTDFYGSDASMTIQIMDLDNGTSEGTISVDAGTGITGVRHIAYDPNLDGGNGGFWVGNWDELAAINMAGTSLVSNSETPTLEYAYGSAWDNWSDPENPKLWLFQQADNGTGAFFYEFDINTMAMTGVTHDAADAPGYDPNGDLAGGACTYESADDKFILVGSIQQEPNLIVGYELAAIAAPSSPAGPTSFTVTPDVGGALSADLAWNNPGTDVAGNALAELTSVEVLVDGVIAHTITSPTIGAAETYTANVTTGGMHDFRVVGYNSSGKGIPVDMTVFVGVDVAVSDIVLPDFALENQAFTPEVTATNNGVSTQSFDVTLVADGYSETMSVTDLASGDMTTITFPDFTAVTAGTYTFTATAADPGQDFNLDNNEIMAELMVFGGCAHTLNLYDGYGDGWSGNTATVTVNGIIALDEVTIENGTEATFTFYAKTGDAIQFDFSASGGYPDECSWQMLDGVGIELLAGGESTEAVTETTTGACEIIVAYAVIFNVDDGAAPIEGANININGADLTTDASGVATVDLADGDYNWTASLAGYTDETGTVSVNGAAVSVDVTLTEAAVAYAVTFNVDDGAAPIEGANININGADLTTDASGVATVDLADGDYNWTASLAGYDDETGSVSVNGAAVSVNVTLTLTETMAEPTVGAPVPTQDPADVISLFSDSYTDIAVDTWRTDWSSGVLEEVSIDGNPAKKYSDLDFVGIETNSATVDASNKTHLHLDVWSPNFTQFSIKLVDFGPDGAYDGGDDSEHQIDIATPAQEEWVSLDIPLSDFSGLASREHLAQYILVGQPTGTTVVYIDNFFFYGESTGVYELNAEISIFPNPSNGVFNVNSTENVTLEVLDITGKVISTQNINGKAQVNINHAGMYFFRLSNENGTAVSKVIVK